MYCILCNLYGNTAPSVCIDFMYAIYVYTLCASYAAALDASKYFYVREGSRKKNRKKFSDLLNPPRTPPTPRFSIFYEQKIYPIFVC